MNRLPVVKFLELLLVCVALGGPVASGAPDSSAPDFSLPSLDGGTVALSELRGQVVLINFWASWCGPCRQEMPLLEQIYQRYENFGFTLLAVNVEPDPNSAQAWLEDTPVSFPVLLDKQNQVSKLYDVIAMPSTVLVDREGKVRYVHNGYEPGYEDEYQNQIRTLIRE